MALPIRARLTIWYTALLAAILLAGALFLTDHLRDELVSRLDQNLSLAASEITVDFRTGGESEFRDVIDSSMGGLPRAESAAQLLSGGGAVIEAAGGAVPGGPMATTDQIQQALRGRSVFTTEKLGTSRSPFQLLAVWYPVTVPAEVLVVGTSRADVERSIGQLRRLLALLGPIGLAAAAAGGWWLAGKGLRPVADMTTRARQIRGGTPGERLDVPKADDQLRRLAVTLNGMLDRLQKASDREHRFIADASHELRSPLAVMSSELEVSLRSSETTQETREVLGSAKEEVDRMTRLVEDLLILARIDEGKLDLLLEPVGLVDAAAVVAHRIAPMADARGVRVEFDGEDGVAHADRARVEQVLTNLVVNAVMHSPPGATVTIAGWQGKREVGLSVADAGSGIPADALPHVFERFYRADRARSGVGGGSGLGLAICKEIVEAHDGRVWAESEVGRGSRFFLALPVAPEAAES